MLHILKSPISTSGEHFICILQYKVCANVVLARINNPLCQVCKPQGAVCLLMILYIFQLIQRSKCKTQHLGISFGFEIDIPREFGTICQQKDYSDLHVRFSSLTDIPGLVSK